MIAPRRHRSNRPFLAAPRVEFYHPAKAIDAALHGLERAIRRSEGIGLVIGAPGTGKSLLLEKVAESVRDDFDVALLSGARICTRRALWQSILAELGEPYRGINEEDLRIGVVERIRGLAATGAGLVVLVDEAHTLPTRLIEELRLLTNIPTPLPAVHIVLAGIAEFEEILATPRLESLSQRIAVRNYLESFDHAETVAYLRTQTKSASLVWDALFENGCEDAVFTASDGVPRLINQICDQALLLVAKAGRERATPADIAAAWREIQRLPPPSAEPSQSTGSWTRMDSGSPEAADTHNTRSTANRATDSSCPLEATEGMEVMEFGSVECGSFGESDLAENDTLLERIDSDHLDTTNLDATNIDFEKSVEIKADASFEGNASFPGSRHGDSCGRTLDPWSGPDVELVFDSDSDPFEEYFEQEEQVVERYRMRGPDDFRARCHVASREGLAMAQKLDFLEQTLAAVVAPQAVGAPVEVPTPAPLSKSEPVIQTDDSNMVVIEEDFVEHPTDLKRSIFAVRPGDYCHLFARLRCGERSH